MSNPTLSRSSALPSTSSAAAGDRLAARSAVRLLCGRSWKVARVLALAVTLVLCMAGVPLSPPAAAVAPTGWHGQVRNVIFDDTGGDAGLIVATTWDLDGELAQDVDPFTSPDAAAFTQRAQWTTQVHQRGTDTCDLNFDGVLERFPWSRDGTGTGSGTVTIQYGVDNNPNAYRLSPIPDGGSTTAEMPAVETRCGAHPADQLGVDPVTAPIADHPAPVDTSGYTWIHGEDVLGVASIDWNLFRASALAFGQAAYSVEENQASATITVTRIGGTRLPVDVRYSTSAGTATPGSDFVATSGVLSFASGETSKSFPVTILPDTVAEGPETIALELSASFALGLLGSPSTATLTIGASDQRPDALISTTSTSGFIGNNVYNTTGTGQTKALSAAAGRARTFYVRVYNDGNQTNTITLKGSAARRGSTVQYFTGTTNVTATMRSTTGLRVRLAPGANKLVRIRVGVLSNAAIGSLKPAIVTSGWVGDGVHADVAKAIAKVIR